MAHENEPSNELRALEAALASLTPRGDRLSRDRLMFLAGQASAGCEPVRRNWLIPAQRYAWPAAFAASSAAAAVFLALWLQSPAPQVVERIVDRPVYLAASPETTPSAAPSTATAARDAEGATGGGYSRLRKRLDRPTPGWWALLGEAADASASLVPRAGDSTVAALYAQLYEGPSGLDFRDLSTGRDFRSSSTAWSDAPTRQPQPATQIELRDEMLRGGREPSPAAPKTIQPKGARS